MLIYTDGSSDQKGHGGYGVYIVDSKTELYGYTEGTNQYAELYAIYQALLHASGTVKDVIIRSDSMYSINCLTVWCKNWEKNGYKTAKGKPIKHNELILSCLELMKNLNVKFEYVKGHSTDEFNRIVELANQGRLLK